MQVSFIEYVYRLSPVLTPSILVSRPYWWSQEYGKFSWRARHKIFISLFLGLGEDCNYDYPKSKYCSNVLSCQSPTPDSPQTCTYSWISYINQNCSRPGCPTYCSCPDDQFLIKADNTTRCCDLCINYSSKSNFTYNIT